MDIYICIHKRKLGTSFRQTYPHFNPGRWDLHAPDPGLWEMLQLVYIYINTCDIGWRLTKTYHKNHNAIVEYLDYQIPVTQLKKPKGNGDIQAVKQD